ncbi:MAG: hypothetical protein JWN46_1591 [Acidimicrobiales bacterium]|nr:hypothetical protein [Acidimicrobiales bacterium]
MADLTLDHLTKSLRDALYVGVGAGVIAFQKLQVQRVELTKQVTTQLEDAKGQFGTMSSLFEDRVKLVEERLESVEARLDSLLDEIEGRLPEQAREIVKQAREAAKDARGQVRQLVNRAA